MSLTEQLLSGHVMDEGREDRQDYGLSDACGDPGLMLLALLSHDVLSHDVLIRKRPQSKALASPQ